MAPKYPGAKTGTFSESAFFGEALVLAVKGIAAADVLRMAEAANLAGKTIMDATNPIADGPPLNGVLPFFTTHDQSLLEKLQTKFAPAHFVKVFNSVGAISMANPEYPGGKHHVHLRQRRSREEVCY